MTTNPNVAHSRNPSPPRLGFGAFKIGRNQGIKYPQGYELPSEAEVSRLLNGLLDLGCDWIDTAPAYGLSEERIGRAIGHRGDEFRVSTKVGETFEAGTSHFDFSATAIRNSLEQSRRRLQRDVLDTVFIHSQGDDQKLLLETDVVSVLSDYRDRGLIRAIGLSGKTVAGATLAMGWADALMVEYHMQDVSHADVMNQASQRGISVFVKKGLASGKLGAAESIRFVLSHPAVTRLIIGGLSLEHFSENWRLAMELADGRG